MEVQEASKVTKTNFTYQILYILAPVLITVLAGVIPYVAAPDWNMGPLLPFVCLLLSVVWWILGGRLIYNSKKKSMMVELDRAGFTRNQTFYGRSCTVVVDLVKNQLALLFFWNPFKVQTFPASRISKAWVDDGRSGKGVMEGSARVSFLFVVDGVKLRVDTFVSNQRLTMKDRRILTGIEKAEKMVDTLETAGGLKA